MRRYRVAHVITRLELGGAQQNTLYCAAHHDRARFEVDLVAGRGGLLDDDALRLTDTTVHLLGELRHPIRPWWDAVALWSLTALFRRRRLDLVHTHSSKAGILGRVAARLAGVPAVAHTVHGWSFNEVQSPPVRRLFVAFERLAAALTDRIVVVTEADRTKGLQAGIGRDDRYRLVRSGIDAALYEHPAVPRSEVRRSLGLTEDDLVVGTIACLKPQKAPLDFVEAARIARAEEPRLRFFVAGDGPLRGAVEEEIRSRGLGEHVLLLGWRRDVADLLHAMDLFLLTSRYEGLPRVVLQAMAAGVPVVATAVDGTPDVVRDGETGALVPPGRPDEAARRLVALSRDPGARERLAARARASLGAEFDVREMVRRLETVYVEVLEPGPG